jgi:hypothetical protein
VADRICCVAACPRKHYALGYCNLHWRRSRSSGAPGSAEARPYKVDKCCIGDCPEPHHARGYCNKHYIRLRLHGDPVTLPEPTVYVGSEHPAWRGEGVCYGRVHRRIVDQKGSASRHRCTECGGEAEDWAYLHGAPDEQRDERGRPYSADPSFYAAMCRSCHKTFDNARR